MLEKSFVSPTNVQTEQLIIHKSNFRTKPNILNRFKAFSKFLGPAFIISVAYIDPGNFATNISGGSIYNYSLVWVVLWSNLMAIFLQSLSAKLGIATGNNLPQMCGRVFSRNTNWFFWVIAELAAMATNLAEFLGSTLGLYVSVKYNPSINIIPSAVNSYH